VSGALLEAAQRLVGWSWGEFLDKKHPSYRKLREDLTHFHNVVSSTTAAQQSTRFGDGGDAAKELATLAARLGVVVMEPSELRKQRAEAHAAGYAEAEGDIRQMVTDLLAGANNLATTEAFKKGPHHRVVRSLGGYQGALGQVTSMIDNGAHVGAAKKGG